MARIDTQIGIKQQVKTTTKITLVIGMITAGFVGLTLFSNAFLAGPISRNRPPVDTNPPFIRLQTPFASITAGTKILSISLMDYSEISLATLSIDGKVEYRENNPKSQWLFVLNTNYLTSGKHVISFTATDSAGNSAASEPISFIAAN
ncbi:MAG: Ig-like domain-containing protein [Patescibacteria group bacterium]